MHSHEQPACIYSSKKHFGNVETIYSVVNGRNEQFHKSWGLPQNHPKWAIIVGVKKTHNTIETTIM